MSLETKTRKILENFETSSPIEILELLKEIQFSFKTQFTREYLKEKMDNISNSHNEDEKKSLCRKLKPYLDWYLQGL